MLQNFISEGVLRGCDIITIKAKMYSEKLFQTTPNNISQPESKEFSFLDSDLAKNILPSLSLEKLSNDEKNQIFELSDKAMSFVNKQTEVINSNFEFHDELRVILSAQPVHCELSFYSHPECAHPDYQEYYYAYEY